MGQSKKQLSRNVSSLKSRLAQLEAKARLDPLKRNVRLHEEIEELRKKLAEH